MSEHSHDGPRYQTLIEQMLAWLAERQGLTKHVEHQEDIKQ